MRDVCIARLRGLRQLPACASKINAVNLEAMFCALYGRGELDPEDQPELEGGGLKGLPLLSRPRRDTAINLLKEHISRDQQADELFCRISACP